VGQRRIGLKANIRAQYENTECSDLRLTCPVQSSGISLSPSCWTGRNGDASSHPGNRRQCDPGIRPHRRELNNRVATTTQTQDRAGDVTDSRISQRISGDRVGFGGYLEIRHETLSALIPRRRGISVSPASRRVRLPKKPLAHVGIRGHSTTRPSSPRPGYLPESAFLASSPIVESQTTTTSVSLTREYEFTCFVVPNNSQRGMFAPQNPSS